MRSDYLSLPDAPGVYRFLDTSGDVLYVGKANNLKSRVSSYFQKGAALGEKTRILVSLTEKIQITRVESELEALLLESFYIKEYRPKYNIRLSDDKTYPLIKITLNDEFPSVLYARRMDNPKALYFGPYPHPKDVRMVLRVLRRIFPFQSVPNHPKNICLYNHLGLCPCLPAHNTDENRKEYIKNLKRIVKILQGKSRDIEKELTKEREELIKKEEFEKAEQIHRQILSLQVITKPHHKPFEYDTNPNLREDLREGELEGLRSVLMAKGVHLNRLTRIECYDISNTQGTHATASMVVFTGGEKDGDQYRRFKMRKDGIPNDFAMMEEVLVRRIGHDEWNDPDLIIVDGGKGQVTAALRAFKKAGKAYPLVGLAKREETIIVPVNQAFFKRAQDELEDIGNMSIEQFNNEESSQLHSNSKLRKLYGDNEEHFIEISLPKNSPSLHLIQRIRDEAHRFAITYHRKVRSKRLLSDTN